ncbi:alpha/beta fold hydrolase [Mucilaginibacter gilvus]|uniref:Alpha/beta hydrolase n=1 Tax=Mucilaginibacter gilvus TaxID=2305909 RepID=A0A3S3Z0C1_9SPHI|nr:alpha/beta hydrolase [Mucilaginibacter gilvus]RWY50171.1 alpha/beta hydrolase [Mucilaginibacter gilvus]
MKKFKQIVAQVKATADTAPEYNDLLWQLICYSPKMPARLQQQQLLDEAEKFSLTAYDRIFTQANLTFNGFKWGSGSRLITITHGWGSKAADFSELISLLREIPDTTIIAFDVPGNGSSEGELSNGDLFARAMAAVSEKYGTPDVMIGHSLGGMANVLALNLTGIKPKLLFSITPLIRLKENFEGSMNAVGIAEDRQATYLQSFNEKVGVPASHYDVEQLYQFGPELNHVLLYDDADLISPYIHIREFLSNRPFIRSKNYTGAGHAGMIRSPQAIADIVAEIKAILE